MLNNNEKNVLNKLYNITNSIKDLYFKLITLELNGKKNSEDYKKILDYLSMTRELEKKYMYEIDDCNKYLSYFEKNMYGVNEMNAITEGNYLYLKEFRIIGNLLIYRDENNKNETILNEAILKDIMLMFIKNLDMCIKKTTNKFLKEKLIYTIYSLIYSNKNIETDLLYYNFNFELDNISKSNYTAYLLNVDNKKYNRKFMWYILNFTNNAMKYITKNTDNFDEETQIILFLKEIIIKSCKDLCSNEKELERQKELVDSYDIGNENYYYSEDRELIKSLFKKNNL